MTWGFACSLVRLVGLALIGVGSVAVPAQGDGGTLRVWRQHGQADIAVFTEPSPVVSGPVDVSVLLLDQSSGQLIQDARIVVEIAPIASPEHRLRHVANEQAATNKLLRAAVFDLPFAGPCDVVIAIDWPGDQARVQFPLDVGTRWSPQTGVWPWIFWPLIPIGLYAIHCRLVHRRQTPAGRDR